MADTNKTKTEQERQPAQQGTAGQGEPQRNAQQGDAGEAEVQRTVDAEQEQGFRGTKVDPTPNENYTLQGVASGAPTPETDAEAARAAREATGIGISGIESQQRAQTRFDDAARERR